MLGDVVHIFGFFDSTASVKSELTSYKKRSFICNAFFREFFYRVHRDRRVQIPSQSLRGSNHVQWDRQQEAQWCRGQWGRQKTQTRKYYDMSYICTSVYS